MTETPRPGPSLPQLDARLTSVMRYWDELRGNRSVPGRIEIRPAALTRHLSRICILERPRAGTIRNRLSGATISARMGMDLRGMPFRSMFEVEDRANAMAAAEMAMTTPAISILSLARAEAGGPQAEALMAILPLTDTRGALTRAMTIYSERPSATPFVMDLRGRFVISESWTVDIPETGPVLGPFGNAHTPMRSATQGRSGRFEPRLVAETPDEMRLSEAHVEHHPRPMLRVIDGGRSD